jgi:hypothetical protein
LINLAIFSPFSNVFISSLFLILHILFSITDIRQELNILKL